MNPRDLKEYVEWFIWALIFGGIIAATLWLLVVHP